MLVPNAGLPAEAVLVIANGLFTHYKRLDRIIAAMVLVRSEVIAHAVTANPSPST